VTPKTIVPRDQLRCSRCKLRSYHDYHVRSDSMNKPAAAGGKGTLVFLLIDDLRQQLAYSFIVKCHSEKGQNDLTRRKFLVALCPAG